MLKVLMIDDDVATMTSFRNCLELDPLFSVSLVGDYKEGLEILHKGKVDIVLLDIMMAWGNRFTPEETDKGYLTGLKVYETIGKEFPNIPVIILSALKGGHYADKLMAQVPEMANVRAVFTKPVSPALVAEKIREICPIRTD